MQWFLNVCTTEMWKEAKTSDTSERATVNSWVIFAVFRIAESCEVQKVLELTLNGDQIELR